MLLHCHVTQLEISQIKYLGQETPSFIWVWVIITSQEYQLHFTVRVEKQQHEQLKMTRFGTLKLLDSLLCVYTQVQFRDRQLNRHSSCCFQGDTPFDCST